MKYTLFLVILVLSASSAFADWVRPVTYAEVIFGCNGLTPDLAASNGTNIYAGPNNVYRLPDGIISFSGSQVLFQGKRIGSLDKAPTCTVEDTGEQAHPSWNKLDFDARTSVVLSYQPDVSTCTFDAETDDFNRTNHFTLSVTLSSGVKNSVSWQEEGHYASPNGCNNIDL
jgi:hypothetical protein